jgi:arylsulfatase A-like enzyme
VITDRATAWLRAHGQKRLILYVYYLDPNSRYDPPAPFRDPFLGDSFSAQHAGLRLTLRKHGKGPMSEVAVIENGATDADRYGARYDEEIAIVDHEVGRLLDTLDREAESTDTLVVLTADHGESLVKHEDYFTHGDFTYQTGAHAAVAATAIGS